MEKKREGYRGSAGEDFIPYITIFCYWGGDREAAGVALTPTKNLSPSTPAVDVDPNT
jgi:hypothetical protein